MHAEIKIGDSRIMLSDESPQMKCLSPQSVGGATGGIFLYVENADDVFNKAVSTGGKIIMPIEDAHLTTSIELHVKFCHFNGC